MRIITVVYNNRFAASKGNEHYDISYRDNTIRKAISCQSQKGAAAAAAAMDLAISADKYIIFADKEVLECIPENLRSN